MSPADAFCGRTRQSASLESTSLPSLVHARCHVAHPVSELDRCAHASHSATCVGACAPGRAAFPCGPAGARAAGSSVQSHLLQGFASQPSISLAPCRAESLLARAAPHRCRRSCASGLGRATALSARTARDAPAASLHDASAEAERTPARLPPAASRALPAHTRLTCRRSRPNRARPLLTARREDRDQRPRYLRDGGASGAAVDQHRRHRQRTLAVTPEHHASCERCSVCAPDIRPTRRRSVRAK